ncbi:hypothetical protein BGZ65_005877, partial [Modicella reniformis]
DERGDRYARAYDYSCLHKHFHSPSSSSMQDTNNKPKAKRPRNPITTQQRLEIIAYHEKNPDVSNADIGDMFKKPRSTVSNIIRDKDAFVSRCGARDAAIAEGNV